MVDQKRKQISVPLTLHEVTIGQVDDQFVAAERISIVDVHLSRIEAEKLIAMLRARLPESVIGTIGVRFTGRMVL